MPRTVGLGHQNFKQLIQNDYFYIDKTNFIKEWWEYGDVVTLITRPRRFGKTLNMSMVEQFLSVKYKEDGSIFEGLSIWDEEKYRNLQGSWPVISLSFANVKEENCWQVKKKICQLIADLYSENYFLLESGLLRDEERKFFLDVSKDMPDVVATLAIYKLSDFLSRYYKRKVIILLDEYDTPMQEAYIGGYWEEMASFIRGIFNSSFKTNPWLERAIMTGITRISIASCEALESVFSDLNNLEVVTTTSEKYSASFGFTEEEVFAAMDEYGLEEKEKVRNWYDGFIFGKRKGIYNPWSMINYLSKKKFETYWANTSSNALAGKLIRESSREIKESFERLMRGEHLFVPIDEQIVFNQLDNNEYAIWSLLLANGYLKAVKHEEYGKSELLTAPVHELALTNFEVKVMFRNMIHGWFSGNASDYNDFVEALLLDDVDAMNEYMNRISSETFSYFDTGKRASGIAEPERFYHGFVLGLMVGLENRYIITSNRESGFGRYDIVLEPKEKGLNACVIEFKVYNPRRDKTVEDTVKAALRQIEDIKYKADLRKKAIAEEKIKAYGFAFEGKNVLIG